MLLHLLNVLKYFDANVTRSWFFCSAFIVKSSKSLKFYSVTINPPIQLIPMNGLPSI